MTETSQEPHGDVDVAEPSEIQDLLNKFATKPVEWGEDQGTDVRNSGFAGTHSTGNRQRLGELSEVGRGRTSSFTAVLYNMASPTQEQMCQEAYEVLSAVEESVGSDFDATLAVCGVPDTACRRTLVGEQTLGYIADLLETQGLSVRRARSVNSFRFGNDGVLISKEVAMFPARVGGNVFCIKAAVLGGHGSRTPLLLMN